MNLEEIITEVEKVEGWFTPDQMRWFYPIIKDAKGLLVEIGTYHGKSTKYWRLANQNLEIVTIDISNNPKIDEDILDLGNITAIHADNRVIAKMWHKDIDILFVDGEDKEICADIDAWWPFLKKKGYMFVHNYMSGGSETRKAVDSWEAEHKSEIYEKWLVAETYVVLKK